MRLVLVVLISVAVCLSLCSCEGTSNPCECSPQSAVTLVWAGYEDDWILAPESRDGETWVRGVVLGDPLPTLQSVDVNDEEFSDPSYWGYDEGWTHFGNFVLSSGLGQMEVAVRTSAGSAEGAVSLPDEITHLEFSEPELLELGEALTVSWPEQDADFYYFALAYEWGDWEWAEVDTLVSGNSVTIDGSFFSHDGVIWDVWIQPTNGPLPQPGATGNMSGYGSGYLYYTRDGYYAEVDIQVGDGLEERGRRSITRDSEVRRAMVQKKVRQLLGLPVQLEG